MQELINELRNEGWSLIKGGFGREFITSAIEWICKTATQADNDKRLEAEFEENSLNGTKQIRKLRRLIWNDIIFWTDLFTRSGIFDLGRSLVPGDLAVIYHAAFLKPKIVGSAIEFHQDQALWSYDYPNAVNIWIALSDSNSQNGCIQLFPRSHLLGLLPHIHDPDYHWHPTVSRQKLKLNTPYEVPMSAGDIIIWHRYLVHGSGPNLSNQDRIGMVIVFADTSRPDFKAKDVYKLRR